jgi:hypothetical protein
VRAYATNSAGTSYGNILSFFTQTNPQISGSVTNSNTGLTLSGVTLQFTNSGGTTATSAGGGYLKLLPFGWSGRVTPAKAGYIFTPAYREYTNLQNTITGQDYRAEPSMKISLAVYRQTERAWIIQKNYASVNLSIVGIGNLDVSACQIVRKIQGGDYKLLRSVTSQELMSGMVTYIDKSIIKGVAYTYCVMVLDSTGSIVVMSNEASI